MSDSSDASLISAQSSDSQPADPLRRVCFCHEVSFEQIRQAVLAGACTLEQIQAQTQAATGCGGCRSDVNEILQSMGVIVIASSF